MKAIFLSLILLGLLPLGAVAQTATLSASTQTPEAGEVFTLQIDVDARNVGSPGVLEVPGLSVLSGPNRSTQVSIINRRMSAKTTFSYQVMADEEGPLEIESLSLEIDGRTVQTKGLKLQVRKASSQPRTRLQPPHLQPRLGPGIPRPANPGSPSGQDRQGFPKAINEENAYLKVVPAREEVYVGETVEVEIKAYLDAGIPLVHFARELSLEGEDFIFQPTVGPDVQKRKVGSRGEYHFQQERVGDRLFNVLTYRTTMTPVKPGEFTLAPVDFNAIIQLPRANRPRNRPRSLLDSMLGDPFDDPIFDSVMNNRRRELRLQSAPVPVKVLPLPTEGRPEHFEGAIGRFSVDVRADKQSLEVDEALTLTAAITGHGNFERIGGLPADEETEASWKSYPPKINFSSTDDLDLSGEKQFEYTYIATAPAGVAPRLRFCYFDPEEKRYVDWAAEPIPVTVTGGSAGVGSTALSNQDLAALADQAAESGLALLQPASTATFFRGGVSGILGSGSTLLAVNGAAAAVALSLVAWQWRRRERPPTPKQRRRALLSERGDLTSELRGAVDAAVFDRAVVRWLALHERLTSGPSADEKDDLEAARLAVQRCPQGSLERRALEDYLGWVDQRRWSGVNADEAPLSEARRSDWLDALAVLKDRPGA